ncbi:MAG: MerR family transcriptional regulator [Aliidongia sp.]
MVDKGEDTLLTAADCARRTGLTVRALRVYEARGFIRPIRTEKGWRLYRRTDLEKLAAIVTLKSLGLSLAEIGKTLQGEPDLARLFRARVEAWQALIEQAEEGLKLSRLALAAVQSPQSPSIEQLCEWVRSLKMMKMPQKLRDAANALYTPEEQEQLAVRKLALMANDPTGGHAAWDSLIADIRRLMAEGANPASVEARAAAQRWVDLVKVFSGGDAKIEAKSKALWEGALDQDPEGKELPFGQAEWAFVASALRAA